MSHVKPVVPGRQPPTFILRCPMRHMILVVGLLLLVAGCKTKSTNKATLTGTITYNGKPVNGATLYLYPTGGGTEQYLIPVTQEGTFDVAQVPAGNYKVVVQPSPGYSGPPMKNLSPELAQKQGQMQKIPPTIPIPKKYQAQETTDLTLTIAPGQQKVDLELKG